MARETIQVGTLWSARGAEVAAERSYTEEQAERLMADHGWAPSGIEWEDEGVALVEVDAEVWNRLERDGYLEISREYSDGYRLTINAEMP